MDQPLPGIQGKDFCRDLTSHTLSHVQRCWFVVQPGGRYDQQGNGTGLLVSPGEHYEIKVHGEQFWYDLDRRVPAPIGDCGGEYTKFISFTKHHTGCKWFALLANVRRSPVDPTAFDPGAARPRRIAKDNGTYSALTRGELFFYANDAAWFYDNNSGRVLIEIQRGPDGIPTGTPPKPEGDVCTPD